MKSRAEEIFYEDLSIRQGAIDERRRLSAYERKCLAVLAKEAAAIREEEAAARQQKPSRTGPMAAPAYRDPRTLPASMRPGARDND